VIVLDASAALEWLVQGPAAAEVERRILAPNVYLHAPHLLDLEVAQNLRRFVTTGYLGEQDAHNALSEFLQLPITRHAHEPLVPRIWSLRANLTAYDAAYIALAEVLSVPLLTLDTKMRAGARHHARIELVGLQ